MKRHSTDLVSLTFGIIFAVVAGWWLVGRYVLDLNIRVPNLGLFVAAGLILLGLLGVVGSFRRERRIQPAEAHPSTAAATAGPVLGSTDMPTVGDPSTMPTVISNPYLSDRTDPLVDDVDTPAGDTLHDPDDPAQTPEGGNRSA